MRHASLPAFLARGRGVLSGERPVALVLVEDGVELGSTFAHHLRAGFGALIAFADPRLPLPPEAEDSRVHVVAADPVAEGALTRIVNACIAVARPGAWLCYLYNAEYLFTPFCEHRGVGELCAFVAEERRASVLTTVVDLYADDLAAHPSGVCLPDAHLDRAAYYALPRRGPDGQDLDRQVDLFGGLRWRFEEHVPPTRRRIDRVSLFRAAPGLLLREDHTFNVPEMNTLASPWHHSPTAALGSFRAAKALRRNPASRDAVRTFLWPGSERFAWEGRQLMELGLMEPGQWF